MKRLKTDVQSVELYFYYYQVHRQLFWIEKRSNKEHAKQGNDLFVTIKYLINEQILFSMNYLKVIEMYGS